MPMGRVLLVLAALAVWAAVPLLVHAPCAFASAPGSGTLEGIGVEADPDVLVEDEPAVRTEDEPAATSPDASAEPPEQAAEAGAAAFDETWCSQVGPWSARFDRDSVDAAKRVARERAAVDEGPDGVPEAPAPAPDGRVPAAGALAAVCLGAGAVCLAAGRRRNRPSSTIRMPIPTLRRPI